MFKSVIGIHSVPRSGSSWCAQIVNSHPDVSLKFQPLFSYAFKDRINLKSRHDEIQRFFEEIYYSDDGFINMLDPEIHKNYPLFEKSAFPKNLAFKHVRYHFLIPHLLKTYPDVKFVLIIRNPFAVLNSWRNAPREFLPQWDFLSEWKLAEKKNLSRPEEYFGYEKWKEAAGIFHMVQKNHSSRVKIIKYSELLLETEKTAEELFDFIGLKLHNQTFAFLNASATRTDKDPNSVFKGKKTDNAWKNNLPQSVVQFIVEDLKGNPLEKYIVQ